jgi:hypothetical protein
LSFQVPRRSRARARFGWLQALPFLLLPSCCIDYEQQGDNTLPVRDTSSGRDTASPESECDGLDNDGDGLVDEGFDDLDGDGVADCVDDECSVGSWAEEDLDESPACEIEVEPAVDPWAVEVMWESSYIFGGCNTGTAIVDLDLDGVSDVLCGGYRKIAAFSGVDGSVLWSYGGSAWYTELAVADVDGDGSWNVVALSEDASLVALNPDGSVAWQGDGSAADLGLNILVGGAGFTIADLLGDGRAEIVTGYSISDARSGVLEVVIEELRTLEFTLPNHLVADLDGDGEQEIVVGSLAFDAFGSLDWELSLPGEEGGVAIPALVQLDADSQAEVAVTFEGGWLVIAEHSGEVLLQEPFEPSGWMEGLSCAGDLDGDGQAELVTSGAEVVRALELDGSTLWTVPIDEANAYSGCSLFDFDLDGAKDILFGDNHNFYIFDGRTGAVRFQDDAHFSQTYGEFPMVADLDGDGSVEIIVPSACGNCDGDWDSDPIRVYRNTNRDWPPGSPIWPSATWSGTSMFVDGSIPRTPEPSWLTTEVWRGQPETMLTGWDLRPEIVESCASSCDPLVGRVTLALRLANLGPQEVQRGAPIAVYGLDSDGTPSLLEVRWFHEFIDNGWASATVELELELEQAERGIVLVAGDDGSGAVVVQDCDQGNNQLAWRLDVCD